MLLLVLTGWQRLAAITSPGQLLFARALVTENSSQPVKRLLQMIVQQRLAVIRARLASFVAPVPRFVALVGVPVS